MSLMGLSKSRGNYQTGVGSFWLPFGTNGTNSKSATTPMGLLKLNPTDYAEFGRVVARPSQNLALGCPFWLLVAKCGAFDAHHLFRWVGLVFAQEKIRLCVSLLFRQRAFRAEETSGMQP